MRVDPRVESVVEALTTEGELERLRAVHDQLPDDDVPAVATATLAHEGTADRGVASAYLRALAGVASDADVAAIAELALTARVHRSVLSKALALVQERIDVALLARVIANIEPSVPYASVVVGAGRRAVRALGDVRLAAVLDEREGFLERHRSLLSHSTAKAKEKARDAAGAALMKLTGDDRRHAALWLLTEGSTSRTATEWAREIVIADPAVHPLPAAIALAADISDQKLPGVLARVTDERALAILDEALERDWAAAVANLAKGRPALFANPRAFTALLRALDDKKYLVITKMFSAITRHWAKPLDDAQAAQIAERMVTLLGDEDEYIVKAVANSCHYFMHPGGIPVFRRALEATLSHAVRDAIYDAVHSTRHRAAHDLLIDRLFVETENLRDLVFSYNQAVPASRQLEVLARIAQERSLDAAWKFVACQVHWAHHPRNVVAAVEHVLAWPEGGDPKKRALIFSCGVKAAIELHRYDLARRCLDALGSTKRAVDPTESGEVETVLAKADLGKQLAALRSRDLDAADQKLADKIAAARATGKTVALDDAQLGAFAKTKVGWVLHRDATTHEVWWFDLEHEFFYYDGSALAAPPFQIATLYPAHGYDVVLPALATYCAGWTTEERLLQRGGDFRYVLRSGAKLLMHVSGSTPGTWWYPFTLVFPDAAAATRAMAALAANPPPELRTVDPFYVPGKGGGALRYEYGNRTEYGFVAGKDMYWGDDRWGSPRPHVSHDEAVAAFSRSEDSALQRGLIPRTIELDERIRALDDLPLTKWLADRAREDDRPATWHLEAFGAIDAALQVTGLTLVKELHVGPPATAAELAAYDASLPEPMPDEMRAMWSRASTVSWRIAERSMRLLSPAEVIANRTRHRDAIAATIKKNREAWPFEHLT